MRPFYVKADIDGRKTPLGGGPARNDGEMQVEILQKDISSGESKSTLAFKVSCRAYKNEWVTTVYDSKGCFVADYHTPR